MFGRTFGRIREHVSTRGLRSLMAAGWRRLTAPIYRTHKVTIVVSDLDNVVVPPAPARDLTVERLGPQHLPALAELNRIRERPEADADFRDNLGRGLFGSVAIRDRAVVAYVWWVDAANVSRHPDLAWLGPAIQLGPKDLYSSDTYVLPEHRGGGTASALLFGAETHLHEAGYKRIFGFIDEGNVAATKFWATRGYVPTQVLERRWIFSRESVRPVNK